MYVIVLIMKYPDIQNKVQDEIRKATGDNELVTLADKDNIPYTEATLNEVWRFCNIVPFTGVTEGYLMLCADSSFSLFDQPVLEAA